ncbi:hypothetical protein TNIN_441941 [Trichonephila inaurata madagascariensis]|uniref:Uncharacterized protein n=1 Tax=Trichonephila inaurata madagascariensis TaxID=2747483 RepID=A0A8X6YW43_9ARAC|nr:hypothetical protein TNIN_441941 [Trichonephila inaurata madagascariensis]
MLFSCTFGQLNPSHLKAGHKQVGMWRGDKTKKRIRCEITGTEGVHVMPDTNGPVSEFSGGGNTRSTSDVHLRVMRVTRYCLRRNLASFTP